MEIPHTHKHRDMSRHSISTRAIAIEEHLAVAGIFAVCIPMLILSRTRSVVLISTDHRLQ